ncbi:RNA 2',3'-cyclic phosphodiesterase [Evansella sp. AB-P1]|uniref:RNA 2',3'-cyclic phosphodiesterase n=1 Tax=Evansella sp. AB-P1 TaxID=3037653 RepID=UPI00241E05A0|nr:RNA 2',3'-cyclic phosphodiesterase [Evansella sp. AB-P1]MDG5787734.1 RNA 2',3'-cyclic phosphodiesterase [Evansella sp. AB-P1]
MANTHHFIGISLPKSIRSNLVEIQHKLNLSHYFKKLTNASDFHITLLFLGGWNLEKKEKLWDSLHGKMEGIPPFQLSLNKISFFGKEEQPRVVWVGLEENKTLIQLHDAIIEVADIHGFELDKRPFRPHITLGKSFASKETFHYKTITDQWGKAFPVDEINLFQVIPGQSPMYKSISKIKLSR